MSSWFDTQVQNLRNRIPFVSPSLVLFIDTVIYNRQDIIDNADRFDCLFSHGEVVLSCRLRNDVKTNKWYELSWVESDGKRRIVSSQDFSLLMWRAIQTHLNVEEQENPKILPYIDPGCRECAFEGKSLKPYRNGGYYYGHHCEDHMPKDNES